MENILDSQSLGCSTVSYMQRKPKRALNKSWRPSPADVRLLKELQEKTGLVSEAELIRMGLRKLAQSEGILATGNSGANLG